MKKIYAAIAICLLWAVISVSSAADTDMTPSAVVGYANLGVSPYDDAQSVMGRPSTWIKGVAGPGFPAGDFACSMVFGAWNTDLSGNKLIATINSGGYITVMFDSPIEDDPSNWYGRDFIVFGNSAFAGNATVYATSNMSNHKINNGSSGMWEPSTVSVSQDGDTWYTYTTGPFADDFAPTQAFTWDRDVCAWDLELDWTKPIDPILSKANFAAKTVADAIDMYNGSAGGTSFDLSSLPLSLNSQGRKWVKYIRINGSGGEVDAICRVSHVPDTVQIADAKLLADGERVRLAESVVTAAKSELGDCLYIESPNRTCGIKVTGRAIERGKKVIVSGVMATLDGERKLKAISVEEIGEDSIAPVGLSNKNLSNGLSTTGILVRVWGRCSSVDTEKRTFIVDDGSGAKVICIAPADPFFDFPTDGVYLTVTGISSTKLDEQSRLVTVLRVRAQNDVY